MQLLTHVPTALCAPGITRRAWVIASASACHSLMGMTPSQAQQVTMYTSNPKATVDSALRVIRQLAPRLKVTVVQGGTGELLQRLAAESAAPKADLLWGGAVGLLQNATFHMQPYVSKEQPAVAAHLIDPQNRWIGTNIHVLGMLVNTLKLGGNTPPETWSDLLNPVWKGRIAMADPARSGTAYMVLYGLFRQLGEKAVDQLAANVVVLPNSAAAHNGVVAGKFAVALTFEYAMQQHLDSGANHIRMLYPSEGSYLVPEGMFLVQGSPRPQAACLLYDLLLSKEVQQALLIQENRRPARMDISVTQLSSLPDLSSLRTFNLPPARPEHYPAQVLAIWQKALAAAH